MTLRNRRPVPLERYNGVEVPRTVRPSPHCVSCTLDWPAHIAIALESEDMRRALLLSAALILSAACGGGGGDGVAGPSQVQTPPAVASVTVSLGVAQLTPSGTTTATSETRSANGTVLTGRVVTWSSSAQAVATVSSAGVVTAVAVGTTTISATSEGRSGSAVITVAPVPVATVTVTLQQNTIVAGSTTIASALLSDAQGVPLDARTIDWTSSAPSIASVDAIGQVTAVAPGSATITATSEGRSGMATLTVLPVPVASVVVSGAAAITPGASVQLSAVVRDANGATLTDRSIIWGTTNTGVATVSVNGLVTGVAPGTVTISASSEGRTGTVLIEVRSVVASVTVSGRFRVKVGDGYQYSVTARTADGTVVERPVAWSVSTPSAGTFTAGGELTPATVGTITIVATIDGARWEVEATAYDWLSLSGSGSFFTSLPADNLITNQFGSSEYPELTFACSSTGSFLVWVSTDRFVTASGLVAFSFDGGTPISQSWLEFDSFHSLGKAGTNASVKSFALQVAGARQFAFAFGEFRSSARATTFRVTGLATRLTPLFAACPGSSIQSAVAEAMRAVGAFSQMSSVQESPELAQLRQDRFAAEASEVVPTMGSADLQAASSEERVARRR